MGSTSPFRLHWRLPRQRLRLFKTFARPRCLIDLYIDFNPVRNIKWYLLIRVNYSADSSRLKLNALRQLGFNSQYQPFISSKKMWKEDQWTVTGQYRSLRPLWKFAGADGEVVYVSDISGEVVQHTDCLSRSGSYFGAVPHWIYFTQLRKDAALWSIVAISLSGAGVVHEPPGGPLLCSAPFGVLFNPMFQRG